MTELEDKSVRKFAQGILKAFGGEFPLRVYPAEKEAYPKKYDRRYKPLPSGTYLPADPLYHRIVELKAQGKSEEELLALLREEFTFVDGED